MGWKSDRRVRMGSGILMGLLLAPLVASADDIAGQITASTGVVNGGLEGRLGEGEHVSLGDDGGCSILVDQDVVVELCGDTSLVLRKQKNRRVVALDRGEIRLVVEPRSFDERVEIHTPAAVATLLGTIVHVSVDAAGVTTISSAESKISIRSRDPAIRGTTVIDTAEQVIVTPGEAPPAKSIRLRPEQIAALGGCLVDFHSAAIGRDAIAHTRRVTDRLASFDAATFESSNSAAPEVPNIPLLVDPIASQEGVCTPTDCSHVRLEFEPNEPNDPTGQESMVLDER